VIVGVLQPGKSNRLYHAENKQEDFVVLCGDCILFVESEERRLRAWDCVPLPAVDGAHLPRRRGGAVRDPEGGTRGDD
jgi:uncharacterized cupin superfamily protein